jgi:hypothetical protein
MTIVPMKPTIARARSLMMTFALLALPCPATASMALNCFGTIPDKSVLQVHAILDCALDDGSFAWCEIDVKIDDQWLNLPRTLRNVTKPGDFPEVPDDLVGTKFLKPPVTVLKVLDENRKIVLELTLDKITVAETAAVFTGRATLSWKERHIKDMAVTCDDPG